MRLTTTDSFHMNPSRPSSRPADTAEMKQMALSHLPVIPLRSSMPSMNMLLPRETISASKPQAIAPENACPTDTRQAMLPMGNRAVQSQL
jgi:hypothetical protein